ncbi:MAG: enoyl-CoA hydratase/isomerase family protein [Ilumatobacteraceae bacterium]
MAEICVRIESDGHRVEIVLSRPERKNSLTGAMAEQLRDAIHHVSTDTNTHCILLRGDDGVFCSGIDLAASGDGKKPGPMPAWPEVHAALYASPVPVVVALERYAINAGAALALAAPVVVAGESSFLQVGELAIGVPAPMCAAWLHLRHAPSVADRLIYGADRVPASELLRLGVVTNVVPDDEVLPTAREYADRLAGYPVAGRQAMVQMWKRLRGEIEDPSTWFRNLLLS